MDRSKLCGTDGEKDVRKISIEMDLGDQSRLKEIKSPNHLF